MILRIYARLASVLIGARVDVRVTPAADAPLAPWGFGQLSSLSLTAVETGGSVRAPLPMQAAAVFGEGVVLGWKAPALLLAPAWLLLRPALLPLLLFAWIRLPNNGDGALAWEGVVDAPSLSRGLWRWLLGLVLDSIARSSLPAVLATASAKADGTVVSETDRLPRSVCTAVALGDGKLELGGQMASGLDLSGQMPAGVGPLDYTLRLGLRPGMVGDDARSCLMWDTPEVRLSLGDGPLARLLPKLWVPLLATSGIALPRAITLRKALVSTAADGVSAAGTLALRRVRPEVVASTGLARRAV